MREEPPRTPREARQLAFANIMILIHLACIGLAVGITRLFTADDRILLNVGMSVFLISIPFGFLSGLYVWNLPVTEKTLKRFNV